MPNTFIPHFCFSEILSLLSFTFQCPSSISRTFFMGLPAPQMFPECILKTFICFSLISCLLLLCHLSAVWRWAEINVSIRRWSKNASLLSLAPSSTVQREVMRFSVSLNTTTGQLNISLDLIPVLLTLLVRLKNLLKILKKSLIKGRFLRWDCWVKDFDKAILQQVWAHFIL